MNLTLNTLSKIIAFQHKDNATLGSVTKASFLHTWYTMTCSKLLKQATISLADSDKQILSRLFMTHCNSVVGRVTPCLVTVIPRPTVAPVAKRVQQQRPLFHDSNVSTQRRKEVDFDSIQSSNRHKYVKNLNRFYF